MPRFRFDTKESICWKAINGEMGIVEAAEALVHPHFWQEESLSFVHPEGQILEEMLGELRKHPQEREALTKKYRERVLKALHVLLDIFTTPDVDASSLSPQHYPLIRSEPSKSN